MVLGKKAEQGQGWLSSSMSDTGGTQSPSRKAEECPPVWGCRTRAQLPLCAYWACTGFAQTGSISNPFKIKCPGYFAVPSGNKCPQSNKENRGRMGQMWCTASPFLPAAGDKAIGVSNGWRGSLPPRQCPIAGNSPHCSPFPSPKHASKHSLHHVELNEVLHLSMAFSCATAPDITRWASAALTRCS